MRDYEEKSYYEIQLDNKQLILVFLAGMTVCVLIFVLGVMVGKGKKEAEMAAMKNEATTTTAAPSPDVTPPQEIRPATNDQEKQQDTKNRKGKKEDGDAKTADNAGGADDYAFYDLDKTEKEQPLTTKEPVTDNTKQKVAEKKESDAKGKVDTKEKKESDVKKTEETPKIAKETTKTQPVEQEVRSTLPDTTEDVSTETSSAGEEGKYTVQVMATASKNKADEQLQLLKAKGYTAFMHTDQIQGGSVYKVRVGKFADPSTAKKTATKIKQEMKLDTWVAVLD